MSKYRFCYVIEVSGKSNVSAHLQLSILQVLRDNLELIVSIFNTKRESVRIRVGEIKENETSLKRVHFSPIDR